MNTQTVGASQSKPTSPIDLGHGLEVRDYRLFPTEDVMRFLVEVHNTTDNAIDTPAVGVVLDTDEADFGWASPSAPVLHPQSSDCLIGIAPTDLFSDDLWSKAEWMLCDELQTHQAEKLAPLDLELEANLDFARRDQAKALVQITNLGENTSDPLRIQGLVWDHEGRLSGTTTSGNISPIAPGATIETGFTISPEYTYISNPFTLIQNAEAIQFSFTLQPWALAVNPACAPVMPWNR